MFNCHFVNSSGIRLGAMKKLTLFMLFISELSNSSVCVAQCEESHILASCTNGALLVLKSTYRGSCDIRPGVTGHYVTYVLEVRNQSSVAVAAKRVKMFLNGMPVPPTSCIELTSESNLGESFSADIPAAILQPYELRKFRFALIHPSQGWIDLSLALAEFVSQDFCT
jgi:hypothetical protein